MKFYGSSLLLFLLAFGLSRGQAVGGNPEDNSEPPFPGRYYRLTFNDEFKGPQKGESILCYSQPAQCKAEYTPEPINDCPAATQAGLRYLNKCNWTVLHQASWMAGLGENTTKSLNALSARHVTVDLNLDGGIGVLVLSGVSYSFDGTPMPAPNSPKGRELAQFFGQEPSKWLEKYNCDYRNNKQDCPFLSGGIYSKRFPGQINKQRGFTQKYGRWEVHAKLPTGPGAYPAHWLLPQSGSWPASGEIDIMEADGAAQPIMQTYHDAFCEGPQLHFPDHRVCLSMKGRELLTAVASRTTPASLPELFSTSYHTYAVEWDEASIRFFIDDVLTGEFRAFDQIYANLISGLETGIPAPLTMPFTEFFVILNHTIHADGEKIHNPLGFKKQLHLIDFVRAYSECRTMSDFCSNGDIFQPTTNRCLAASGATYASPCQKKSYHTPNLQKTFSACTEPCPYGGYFDSQNCRFMTVPQPEAHCDHCGEPFHWRLADGRDFLYYTPVIASPTWENAEEACPVGKFDGLNCQVSEFVPGVTYFTFGKSHYYEPVCR